MPNNPNKEDMASQEDADRLLDFLRPGRPMENGYIESFNGKFRDECLSVHWFRDLRVHLDLVLSIHCTARPGSRKAPIRVE